MHVVLVDECNRGNERILRIEQDGTDTDLNRRSRSCRRRNLIDDRDAYPEERVRHLVCRGGGQRCPLGRLLGSTGWRLIRPVSGRRNRYIALLLQAFRIVYDIARGNLAPPARIGPSTLGI